MSKEIKINIYDTERQIDPQERAELVTFLFRELERFGDPEEEIQQAVSFTMGEGGGLGGYLFLMKQGEQLIGASVVNATGMADYVPPYLLVYIAVSASERGQGLGKQLLQTILEHLGAGVALHVEPDNPALALYKRLGFTNKYLEMRYLPSVKAPKK